MMGYISWALFSLLAIIMLYTRAIHVDMNKNLDKITQEFAGIYLLPLIAKAVYACFKDKVIDKHKQRSSP